MEYEAEPIRVIFVKPAYNLDEFAVAVGLSKGTIRNIINRGELRLRWPTKGKPVVFAEDALEWLRSLPTDREDFV